MPEINIEVSDIAGSTEIEIGTFSSLDLAFQMWLDSYFDGNFFNIKIYVDGKEKNPTEAFGVSLETLKNIRKYNQKLSTIGEKLVDEWNALNKQFNTHAENGKK